MPVRHESHRHVRRRRRSRRGRPARGARGNNGTNGAQAEALRIPFADGTVYALPVGEDDALMPSVPTLSDVMGTGHHAAVVAKIGPGRRAAVAGDGAVGMCAVIAAKRLGAEQIIVMGRHEDRIALAREFGATDVVSAAATAQLRGTSSTAWKKDPAQVRDRRSASIADAGR